MKKWGADFFSLILFLFSFSACLLSIHIRTKTTMLGYDIGKLKSEEAELLINNSLLNMELSKITAKQWLLNFIGPEEKKE
jgi:hypothetical protein